MMPSGTRYLWRALRPLMTTAFRQFDFLTALVGAIGLAMAAWFDPRVLPNLANFVTVVVGVVLGAVLGGASIQAAFMDQEFLRKLKDIGKPPERYLAPFLFTATLAVFAMVLLLVLTLLPHDLHPSLAALAGGVTGLASLWAVLSLLPCLAMLVQFVRLKAVAADVPDRSPGDGRR